MTRLRKLVLGVVAVAAIGFAAGALVNYATGGDSGRPTASTRDVTATAPLLEPVATYSIVGFDPESGDLGIAVQSKFFGVGAVVPWARAGVGAVATQSYANTAYGPDGLQMLADGADAAATVAALTGADERRAQRQLGIVDAHGGTATFTGAACLAWAGGRTGEHYAAQGNILAGPEVVDAMAAAYETTVGSLAERLMAALAAGQMAGGDARGRQSAALLVVRAGAGYGGNDRYIDLRVDDHSDPIRELQRLLDMRRAQLANGQALRLLETGLHDAARHAARRAIALHRDGADAWMNLARIELAAGNLEAGAAAGREALLRDPWMKTAALRGMLDARLIEELLGVESFARLWESLPPGRRD